MESGDEIVLAEDFLNFLKSSLDLSPCVGCHEAEADESVVGSDSGGNDGVDKDAFLEEVAGDFKSLEVVADVKGNDGSGGVADFTTHVAETFESEVGVFPKHLLKLGLAFHDVDCLEGGGGGSGSDRSGEDVGA